MVTVNVILCDGLVFFFFYLRSLFSSSDFPSIFVNVRTTLAGSSVG